MALRVQIIDIGPNGEETKRGEPVPLRETWLSREEFGEASAELRRSGRFWTGGGAAPLVLLLAVS